MSFNVSKCKVLEIKSNKISTLLAQNDLSMADADGSRIDLIKTNSEKEKDLGVVLGVVSNGMTTLIYRS